MDDQDNWLQAFVEYCRDTALESVSGLNKELASAELSFAEYRTRQIQYYQTALSNFLADNPEYESSRATIENVSSSLDELNHELYDGLGRYSLATMGATVAEMGGHALAVDAYFSEMKEENYDKAFGTASSIIIGIGIAATIPATFPVVLSAMVGGLATLGLERALVSSGIRDYLSSQLSEVMYALSSIDADDLTRLSDEIIASIESFSQAIAEAGISSIEELDAFLAPLWKNLDSGITLESSWGDWEFASQDTFDLQPTFANAESITSPIIIDLNANGIATTSLNEGVYFDHNADGLAEKTAWVSADDGLLALDRNGDALINSGAELFGNHTQLSGGATAANGFEALAELDANGDGIIDAEDAAYSELRIWRDANQDGVSQSAELLSLEQAGISAIATDFNSTDQTDLNGNRTLQVGMATLADGTEVEANDIWFKTNSGFTQTVTPLDISESIAELPTAQGFGQLHDLDQAMARDHQLEQLVSDYVATEESSARRAMIDAIIYQWAGVAEVDPNSRDASRIYGHVMDARQLETLEALVGEKYLGTWCWGERDPNPHGRAAPVLIAQYQQFAEFVSAQLEAQTTYAELFDLIGVRWDVSSLSFKPDVTPLIVQMVERVEQGDLTDVVQTHGLLESLGSYSTLYREMADEVAAAPGLMLLLASNLITGSSADDQLSGTAEADIIHGQQGEDRITGGAGDDTYIYNLGDGVDIIYDSQGDDLIRFGEGVISANLHFTRTVTELIITRTNDQGESTADQIVLQNLFDFDGALAEGAVERLVFADGTELLLDDLLKQIEQSVTDGNDQLYGSADADRFDAGLGDDQLYGGAGDDTYRFERGDGRDELFEHSGVDTLSFGVGIGPENLQLQRTGEQGSDILIQLLDELGEVTADAILIRDAYQNLRASSNQIEWLRFDDEPKETPPLALTDLIKAFGITSDADLIYGFESDDYMDALAGDDTVHGAGGNDYLSGGLGNDMLFGETGDDILNGGSGSDMLSGGAGNDTYLFTAGMGHDRVRNLDSSGFDRVRFDSSINAKRVAFSRHGDDLLLSHNRNAESLLLENFFEGDRLSASAVDQFLFADGSVLDISEVIDLTLQSTQQDDLIRGLDSADQIASKAGDDSVFGGGGDDLLLGEQGADQLFGEAGADRLFGGAGDDQLFGGLGSDQLYGGAESDLLKGSAGRDDLYGGRGSDRLFGGSQGDHLDGGRGNDELFGEQGDDLLIGGEGSDLLVGGAGNDQFDGGQGNDTYLYHKGDGTDQIVQSADPEGFDILLVEGFDTEDLWLSQRDDDLIVSFRTTSGSVEVDGWFSDHSTIDLIETETHQAYATDIERMVEAMVVFDAAESEAEVADAQIQLVQTLNESWHEKVS